MSKEAEFRQQAADAPRMADRAITAADKEAWLRIAQGFLSLIPGPSQTAGEAFDEEAQTRGTRQDISKESQ